MGAPGALDSVGETRRAAAQNRLALGDERDLLSSANGCPWRYLPRGLFPPRSTVYNVFRAFQRQGVLEAIWEELCGWPLRERRPPAPGPEF